MLTDLRRKSNLWLRQQLKDRRYRIALNVGCGSDQDMEGGTYSDYIQAERVLRTDLAPYSNLHFQSRAEELPLPNGSVDFIFSNWMYHKTDIEGSINEFRRVLRTGGDLLISFAAPQCSPQLAELQTAVARYVAVQDRVAIPYRAPRDRTSRVGELVFGKFLATPTLDFVEQRQHLQLESLELAVVPPVLLLVAHWDDEVVSAGGTLLRLGHGWDVVCATNREHMPEFRSVFESVCHDCGAMPKTLDIPHRTEPYDGRDRDEFSRQTKRTRLTAKRLSEAMRAEGIDPAKYQTVVTHHPDGDVGNHPHHRELAKIARQLFAKRRVLHFARGSADCELRLTEAEFERKQEFLNRYRSVAEAVLQRPWQPCSSQDFRIEKFSHPRGWLTRLKDRLHFR